MFPATGTGGPSEVALPPAQNPDLKTSYSLQYNFTIERQQWNTGFRASYIGTAMRQGVYQYNYNAPVANTQLYIDKARPFPNYPDIYYVTNGAGHQYNGLTLEALRHLAKGLYFQSSWTWARDRYDMDYNWDFDNWQVHARRIPGTGSGKSARRRRFRRTVGPRNFIYQLPFGRGGTSAANLSRLRTCSWADGRSRASTPRSPAMFLTPFWTGDDPVGHVLTRTQRSPARSPSGRTS